jgi:hypothetical protein
MVRSLAFFARSLALVSIALVGCSSGTTGGTGGAGGKGTGGGSAGVGGKGTGGGTAGGGGGNAGGTAGGGTAGGGGTGVGGGSAGAGGKGGGGGSAGVGGKGTGGSTDGGRPDGGGLDAAPPADAGAKLYGTIPPAPPKVYTCALEIHVATTGDDAVGDGTSLMPYKTIEKGISLATAPGTCVQVHAGTYTPAVTITFPSDGASGNPIVLRSADGKGMASIDGTTVTAAPTLEVKRDYAVVDGFVFKNTPLTSGVFTVRFDGQSALKCEGSVLRNSTLTGGYSQLKIYQNSHGVLVENNEFSGPTGNSTMSLTGASGMVFRANYVHDINTGDLGTTELVGGSTGATIEKNLFQDISSSSGALVLGDACGPTCDNDPQHYAAVNAVARNNIFIRVNRAIDIFGCESCSVLSNTILDAGALIGYVFRIGSANTNGVTQTTTGLRIVDNLVASPTGVMGYVMDLAASSSTGLSMDYNLFYNGRNGVAFGQSHPATADTHSVMGDPLLAADLRPGAGSPAIGAGANLVSDVPDDFLSVARPATAPFDIGALQH